MKVNCQTDSNDKLLTMVKQSMKKQVSGKQAGTFGLANNICNFRFCQIDLTAVIGSFFPELETLIAWLYRGGRKKTNDVIISWCNDILQTRRGMQMSPGNLTGSYTVSNLLAFLYLAVVQ